MQRVMQLAQQTIKIALKNKKVPAYRTPKTVAIKGF
jgi:hypothetical protein